MIGATVRSVTDQWGMYRHRDRLCEIWSESMATVLWNIRSMKEGWTWLMAMTPALYPNIASLARRERMLRWGVALQPCNEGRSGCAILAWASPSWSQDERVKKTGWGVVGARMAFNATARIGLRQLCFQSHFWLQFSPDGLGWRGPVRFEQCQTVTRVSRSWERAGAITWRLISETVLKYSARRVPGVVFNLACGRVVLQLPMCCIQALPRLVPRCKFITGWGRPRPAVLGPTFRRHRSKAAILSQLSTLLPFRLMLVAWLVRADLDLGPLEKRSPSWPSSDSSTVRYVEAPPLSLTYRVSPPVKVESDGSYVFQGHAARCTVASPSLHPVADAEK